MRLGLLCRLAWVSLGAMECVGDRPDIGAVAEWGEWWYRPDIGEFPSPPAGYGPELCLGAVGLRLLQLDPRASASRLDGGWLERLL